MRLNTGVVVSEHFLYPRLILMVPLTTSTDTKQQVTMGVKTTLTSVGHSSLPLRGILNELTLMAEPLQNDDSFRHAHVPGASVYAYLFKSISD